jgi:hypothetical protein
VCLEDMIMADHAAKRSDVLAGQITIEQPSFPKE